MTHGAFMLLALIAAQCVFWAILTAVIWGAKGGDWRVAAFGGLFFGFFATVYCAFATPKPAGWVHPQAAPVHGDGPLPLNANSRVILPWRERRLGALGWLAASVAVTVAVLLVATAPH